MAGPERVTSHPSGCPRAEGARIAPELREEGLVRRTPRAAFRNQETRGQRNDERDLGNEAVADRQLQNTFAAAASDMSCR